jgi:metal-responsive CopG/Arc/MetJ family transcriptional regulator
MSETIKKIKKKRPSRKAKPRAQAVLSVISVRISDEEKERIDEIMREGKFNSYSDILRMAMQMYRIPTIETQRATHYH